MGPKEGVQLQEATVIYNYGGKQAEKGLPGLRELPVW